MENPKPSTADATSPKPRREWTNPALRAMGIKRIRIPSRNWSIFWAVTGSITGLYFYDRRERKAARQHWKDHVSHLSQEQVSPLTLPRKVTVYIAPPPADFLDLGFAHFRHYIKPILTAAAIDYEVKHESRQGEIRNMVAENIRQERRKSAGIPEPERELEEGEKTPEEKAQEAAITKQLQAHLTKDETGGVICVGRGAYKEYMNGIQEGWFGPLEAPIAPKEQLETLEVPEALQGETPAAVDTNGSDVTLQEPELSDAAVQSLEQNLQQAKTVAETTAEVAQDVKAEEPSQELADDEEQQKKKKKPVPKTFIKPEEYASAQLPAEFYQAKFDPIAPISFPHLIGFLAIPVRIYRFFTQRYLADRLGEATAAVVYAQTRPFTKDDAAALIEEEDEWPSRWKKKGLESGSEWMQDLIVDDRIGEHLQIYTFNETSAFGAEDVDSTK